jgi:hypothetical protein
MKRPFLAAAVAVISACDPCGRCGPCGQPVAQRKPSEGLRVTRAAADPYREARGYAGQQNGRHLRGLAADEQD